MTIQSGNADNSGEESRMIPTVRRCSQERKTPTLPGLILINLTGGYRALVEGEDDESTQNQGHALVVYKNRLIMGGRFTKIDGRSLNNIAQLDDELNAWMPLQGGGVDHTQADEEVLFAEANTFLVAGERLYVGVSFDRIRVR